jgi:hypothetical protein
LKIVKLEGYLLYSTKRGPYGIFEEKRGGEIFYFE